MTKNGTNLLKLKQISFRYRKSQPEVIRNCSFELKKGEAVALTGESGSGKSTILGILGGLLKPNSGSYFFDNGQVDFSTERSIAEFRRKHIGFVFQNVNLLPHLNVLNNILLPVQISRYNVREWEEKAYSLLEKVDLVDLSARLPKELSGGQAQRVAIARALILSPALLLADEPTGNLDSRNEQEVIELLIDCLDPEGGLVVVSHSSSVANNMGRTLEFRDGSLATRNT